jgi:ring-1,2-phenylacetyl-CoA epoxidase subunit PaaB
MLNSFDPRVKRLPKIGQPGDIKPKAALDQFGTFEVFVQPKTGKPFQHEGNVHAPNIEMAYVLAKETFTRRFTCTSLFVVETRHVHISPLTEGTLNVYDLISEAKLSSPTEPFEIFHLLKRGKQHIHAGTVQASDAASAMFIAKSQLKGDKTIYNVWAIRQANIRFTHQDDLDLWATLPEKKFRDALDYKGGDKLKSFLEQQNHG